MVESSFPDSSGNTSCGQDQQGQQQHHRARHGLCPKPQLQTLSVTHSVPPSFWLTDIPPYFIPYSKLCPLFVCGSPLMLPFQLKQLSGAHVQPEITQALSLQQDLPLYPPEEKVQGRMTE